ncbi:MAG: hypothetical protein Q4G22_07315 [Paracoccus sp. (in: a-proteobacteria)]|nr:hypothetical protein [Paracoccus sp. (in: a-proteobacteria)]MDO5631631.1 hypothetical protein [Paracoccus sp. (in: a-proteobacteria)]
MARALNWMIVVLIPIVKTAGIVGLTASDLRGTDVAARKERVVI